MEEGIVDMSKPFFNLCETEIVKSIQGTSLEKMLNSFLNATPNYSGSFGFWSVIEITNGFDSNYTSTDGSVSAIIENSKIVRFEINLVNSF